MSADGKNIANSYCLACGYVPKNKSQAIAHVVNCGPIVRDRKTKTKTK